MHMHKLPLAVHYGNSTFVYLYSNQLNGRVLLWNTLAKKFCTIGTYLSMLWNENVCKGNFSICFQLFLFKRYSCLRFWSWLFKLRNDMQYKTAGVSSHQTNQSHCKTWICMSYHSRCIMGIRPLYIYIVTN